jgi:hypothetical protein
MKKTVLIYGTESLNACGSSIIRPGANGRKKVTVLIALQLSSFENLVIGDKRRKQATYLCSIIEVRAT